MTEVEQQMKGTVAERQRDSDNDGDGGKTREEGRKLEGEWVEKRDGLKGVEEEGEQERRGERKSWFQGLREREAKQRGKEGKELEVKRDMMTGDKQ